MSDRTREIIGFEGDTCIHASAGTGKTYLLVEKFFRVLSTEREGKYPQVDGILAITFTEKAADEMRQRIAKRIFAAAHQAEPHEPDHGKRRLANHLLGARRRLSHAYISTIHSFCARILRENPVEAGLDPQFEIMDEPRSSELMSRALNQFLLARLRKKDPVLLDLAYRYGFSKSGGFESSLVTIVTGLFPLVRAADMNERALMARYETFLADAEQHFRSLLQKANDQTETLLPNAQNGKAKEMLEEVRAGLGTIERGTGSEEALRLSVKIHTSLNLQNFRKHPEAKTLKETLGEIPKCLASQLARPFARQLAALMGEFAAWYARTVKNRALLDFDDLQESALALLTRNPRIRGSYRDKFHAVLVDEFQDVNRLQREIIYALALPGEGKLFIVGDPKQAIYGFRGGEVRVFEEARNDIQKNGGALFPITTNRRSTPELVAFANSFFREHASEIFSAPDVCESNHPAAGKPGVEWITFPPLDSADDSRYKEARLMAAKMRQLAGEGFRYRDMAVLFRKFTALPLYESAFRGAGVSAVVHRGAGFFQSQEVADVASVLAWLENPSDLVAWVGALRSPLAGCSDETMLALRRRNDGALRTDLTLETRLLKGMVPEAAERAKLEDFLSWAERLRETKDRMTVSEVIETVIEKSGFTGILGAQPNGIQKVANVLKLIEMARAVEAGGNATLKNFVRRVTSLMDGETGEPQAVAAGPEEDVVRIMTVHQSKGLEFPVVFVPDIDSGGGGPNSPVAFDQRAGIAVKYVDRASRKSYGGKVFGEVTDLKKERGREDDHRIFYVACTRAMNLLVLSGFQRERNSQKRWQATQMLAEKHPGLVAVADCAVSPEVAGTSACAYDVLKAETGGPPSALPLIAATNHVAEPGDLFLSISSLTAYKRCKREYLLGYIFGLTAAGDGGKGARAGSAIHTALEKLDFSQPETAFVKSARKTLTPLLSRADRPGEAHKALVGAYHLLQSLYGEGFREAAREIPFTCAFPADGHSFFLEGKIDLLLRGNGGTPCVLDYKYTGQKSSASAVSQVELYGLALARLTGTETVECAIAFLKGKPALHRWTLDAQRLARVEQEVGAACREIAGLEKELRGAKSLPPTSRQVCPNRRCAFAGFCLAD